MFSACYCWRRHRYMLEIFFCFCSSFCTMASCDSHFDILKLINWFHIFPKVWTLLWLHAFDISWYIEKETLCVPASARESMHALFPNPAFHWPWVCAERCFMCWMRMLLESRAALNATEFFFGSGIHQLFGIIVKLLSAESRMSCPQKQQRYNVLQWVHGSFFVFRVFGPPWERPLHRQPCPRSPGRDMTRHDETWRDSGLRASVAEAS